MEQVVKAWEEKVTIPTYKTGKPEKNPMFLEKRVYQGSSGVVYPYAVIDKVYDEKNDKEYIGLFLENEYIKVMILPEIGGRIQMAYDKTNDYHFVYYNHVIKPALVGLTGPWISGGIEFNWPQHHRPSTFEPTDYLIKDNPDGSKTVWVNEYEKMFQTKCAVGFTLYPDKAYIEVHGKLYNPTPFPQTFLWWANPAVSVDEHYQSVFPPDVNAVFDHGKRDVISFPIAKGTYYKVDYSPGTDISVFTNIPVPTSYMAVNSEFNFVGGYDHKKKAGIMHVANHHISPGKKQWTWGCGEFGKAWDKQLTDEDGPYFELMCGVFTDNQPDFGWIMPNEYREFKQYFMPYKDVGYVKNASIEAMINLEVSDEKNTEFNNAPEKERTVELQVYLTQSREVTIRLWAKDSVLYSEKVTLSPTTTFNESIRVIGKNVVPDFYAEVLDAYGNILIGYRPVIRNTDAIPDPAKAIGAPSSMETIEELYFAGLHLEQYRHATYSPLDYYNEALTRDNTDVRCNNAMGLWNLRRGQFEKATPYFRKAINKMTKHNPNPYDGEPLYNLGLCLKNQGRHDEAFQAFYKAAWNAAMQDKAYLQLAYISGIKNDWHSAYELAVKSVIKNFHSLLSRHIQAVALRKLGRLDAAISFIKETLEIDRFDFASKFELIKCYHAKNDNQTVDSLTKELKKLLRGRTHSYIEVALQYYEANCFSEAVDLLSLIKDETNDCMVFYYLAYFEESQSDLSIAEQWRERAFAQSPDGVFPNRIQDVMVLEHAAKRNKKDFKAWYYLGNYYYAKRLYEQARKCWEESVAIKPDFATVSRNLGLAYYNKFNMPDKALALFKKAFFADPTDARVLFELDQLYKKLNHAPADRLAFLEKYYPLVNDRDDLFIEFVTLYSLIGQFIKAKNLLLSRKFHPWEGGEGKTSGQHVLINVELAKAAIEKKLYVHAKELLDEAQQYPENISEGKLYGAQENDIFYWMGCVKDEMIETQSANEYWQKASTGLSEPAPAIFYNDQQPDKIFYQGLALEKLGKKNEAKQRFDNLIRHGQKHLNDKVKMDYFAVSLPDLMIFDDDLSLRNHIHCLYLLGLGYLGLKDYDKAKTCFDEVLNYDKAHLGATLHRKMVKSRATVTVQNG